MHAQRDIVIANPSVCPSVRRILVMYRNECTYRHTLSTIWNEHDCSFQRYHRYKIPRETPSAGAFVKYTGWEKFAIFDRIAVYLGNGTR